MIAEGALVIKVVHKLRERNKTTSHTSHVAMSAAYHNCTREEWDSICFNFIKTESEHQKFATLS